ncbi:hypothetical protein L7F22_069455 [Adiantum nelumboides]|nr:hypothetical protein [Adiantum nelumboides]
MAKVEARKKELANARAAKAAKSTKSMTTEEARKIRMKKAKAIQEVRRRLEAEQKAQEEAAATQSAQATKEEEVVDMMSTIEYLKKVQRDKHTEEQRAAQLARNKIKEALKRKMNPSPPSVSTIAPRASPPSSLKSPSSPKPPPSQKSPEPTISPLAPNSPQQQQETVGETVAPPPSHQEDKEKVYVNDKVDEEMTQVQMPKSKPAEKDVQIPLMQLAEPTQEEAYEEVITQERDWAVKDNENMMQDLLDTQVQLTCKEAQYHELLKKEKKMEEQLRYEDSRFQKINASYNTLKNTLTTLLQNQEPATAIVSTFNSATMNTLTALQEELQTEKLHRQLLVYRFMTQTVAHEAKIVKSLNLFPELRLHVHLPYTAKLASHGTGHEPSNPRDTQKVILNVFDVRTGKALREFKGTADDYATGGVGGVSGVSWPVFRWAGGKDDKYFARIGKNAISVYETETMGLLDKKSVKVDNVADFSWSPTDSILACFVPEGNGGNQPARVSLVQIPSREELRQKNLFSVSDCKIYWQSIGDYLAVKVDRYTKTKKSTYTGFELFRIKERDRGFRIGKQE